MSRVAQAVQSAENQNGTDYSRRAMSAVGERPRGPPRAAGCARQGPRPTAQDPRAQGEGPEGSVATSQDGLSTRATSRARAEAISARSPRCVSSAGPVTGRGGKATRPPPSAPGTPPEPATEAAVAPRGPRPGKRGKREEWTVLGDVGASRLSKPILLAVQRERLEKKSVFFSPASICDCSCHSPEHRLTHFTSHPVASLGVSIRTHKRSLLFQTSTNPCSRRRSRRSARSSRWSPSTCPTCPRTCTGAGCRM